MPAKGTNGMENFEVVNDDDAEGGGAAGKGASSSIFGCGLQVGGGVGRPRAV